MDAITAINQRIAEIQATIDGLAARPVGAVATSSASFADALSAVNATDSVAGLAPVGAASLTDVGAGGSRVNADNVPLAYLPYGNGKVPLSQLSPVEGTSARLWPPAARSFEAMRAAAGADGMSIGVTDSYRPYDAQVDVAARKGLYSQGGLAAVPGTSRHGWGMALDLKLDADAQAWMSRHGTEYGFVQDVPREPWHWEYQPNH
ncbi:M15 family metallopeptidase [Isoptericola sp. b441]|uniref:M15 family metallopeptidase n=1 Tax=Actinotalea lenta TaxID=3064654 RepID=A0ABT9D9W2_9CELL|nr:MULTISPECIES: M15 family metallopeptidase [unclassified Isoptericola]MDO8106091.1 M15 family metallopeptidase [Isoptericola sp. b441]MDO8122190.1 M15 family metallopeptidase [Isoptericola sp. b490]